MNKTLALLAGVALIAFTAPAIAADSTTSKTSTKMTRDSEGNYERKASESTDSPTGSSSAETKVKVDVDSDGNSTKTVTSEHTDDPNGLLNKTKTSTKDKIERKDGKTMVKHTRKVNGRTVEDSETSTSPSSSSSSY